LHNAKIRFGRSVGDKNFGSKKIFIAQPMALGRFGCLHHLAELLVGDENEGD
jgi:hypothetical protein